MYHLVYRSIANGYVTPKIIDEILATSRSLNGARGITGLLVYRSGHYIQVLEGETAAVRDTYERILEDRRHSSVQILLEFEADERLFPNWNMGHIAEEKQAARFSAALDQALRDFAASPAGRRERVVALFREFSQPFRAPN